MNVWKRNKYYWLFNVTWRIIWNVSKTYLPIVQKLTLEKLGLFGKGYIKSDLIVDRVSFLLILLSFWIITFSVF